MTRKRRLTGYLYHDRCWQDRQAVRQRHDAHAIPDYSDPVEIHVRRRCAWCDGWIEPAEEACRG